MTSASGGTTAVERTSVVREADADPTQILDAAPSAGPIIQPFRFSVVADYIYGPVQGSIQVPSGGRPGTTSSHRPTLSEIGINEAGAFDARAAFHFGADSVYVGAQFLHVSGSDTLHETLVTHGVTFAAGTPVSSDVSFDTYRIGYEHDFILSRGDGPSPELTLRASAGAALFSFDYHLKETGGDGLRTSRSFTKGAPQVGLAVEWRPGGGPFAVSAGAAGFPAIGTATPQITTEELVVSYRILQRPELTLDGFVGVAFEQFDFKDGQSVPNHVRAELGPAFLVGLEVHF